MPSRVRGLCTCGGSKAQHTGDEGCWCFDCQRKPETERCRQFIPREPVDKNTAPVGRRHPLTAKAAADRALPRTGTRRREIYDLIRKSLGGLTDDELETITTRSHQAVSAARNSLLVDGLVYDTGQRRLTRYGSDAIVWGATPLA